MKVLTKKEAKNQALLWTVEKCDRIEEQVMKDGGMSHGGAVEAQKKINRLYREYGSCVAALDAPVFSFLLELAFSHGQVFQAELDRKLQEAGE